MSYHKVWVALLYTANGTPYKWRGLCVCGWGCLSWQWQRDDGSGAFQMAFEHARESQL